MKNRGIESKLFLLLTLFIMMSFFIPFGRVYAASDPASAVQVAAVEYYDDNLVVFNNGNSKIYFATDSDAANGMWDVMPADNGIFTVIDISWLNSKDENVIMIKGDEVPTVTRAVIKAKPQKLNVSINYSGMANLGPTESIAPLVNIMSSEGNAAKPINFNDLEWKKGDYGKWHSTTNLTTEMLQKLMIKGANIYFRIRAVDDTVTVYDNIDTKDGYDPTSDKLIDLNENRVEGVDGGICAAYLDPNHKYKEVCFGTDYPDGTEGRRFSNEVALRISKMISSTVTTVDGEKFTAAIKYGKEYRVTATYKDGTQAKTPDWIQITDKSVKKVSLVTLANSAIPVSGSSITFDGTTKAFPMMNIEVRDFATTRSAASKITDITLDYQRELTKNIQFGIPTSSSSSNPEDIYMYYFGNKYVLLTIPAASADLPYEYCIVKPGASFDLEHASWTVVTRGSGVKILASRAADGSTLYVRQREIKYKKATATQGAVSYQLASTYISEKINYPSVPVVTKDDLTYVKDFTKDLKITVQLNSLNKLPFETNVDNIKLGSKIIGFKEETSPSGTIDDKQVYTLTITLNNADLEAVTNCTNRILTITFKNGTVDKTSIKITVRNKAAASVLKLSGQAGSSAGTTKVSVLSTLGSGNSWVYVLADAPVSGLTMEDKLEDTNAKDFDPGVPITPGSSKYIIVYEIDTDTKNIVKYGNLEVTSTNVAK